MDDLITLVPEKWRWTLLLAAVLFPYFTRAWHAWKAGGGWFGIRNAILFGTNTPKDKP